MELRVYGKQEPPQPIVQLALTKCGREEIEVQAVDESGRRVPGGSLLVISPKGVCRIMSINKRLGFALTDDGRLVNY